MLCEPKLYKVLSTKALGVSLNLKFANNLTFLYGGDSCTGKSFLCEVLREFSVKHQEIHVFDYKSNRKEMQDLIKESSGVFFVIDNADLLLDTNIRHTIAFDCSNQYLIIGRNPSDLMLVPENVCELTFENSTLAITEQL